MTIWKPKNNDFFKVVQTVAGVLNISFDNGLFQVGCSADITDQLAQTIVTNGFALIHLNFKEYGLDDIYHRYFEGRSGLTHKNS
jgi:ABC-2 type transport system ATP-binding protein